jgi:hypothetical protein
MNNNPDYDILIKNYEDHGWELTMKMQDDQFARDIVNYIFKTVADPIILIVKLLNHVHQNDCELPNGVLDDFADDDVRKIIDTALNYPKQFIVADILEYAFNRKSLLADLYEKWIPFYIRKELTNGSKTKSGSYLWLFPQIQLFYEPDSEFLKQYFDTLMNMNLSDDENNPQHIEPEIVIQSIVECVEHKTMCENLLNYAMMRYDYTITNQLAIKLFTLKKMIS